MNRTALFVALAAISLSAQAEFSNSRGQAWTEQPVSAEPISNGQTTPVEPHRLLGNQTAAAQRDSVQDVYGANARVIRTSSESRTLSCPAGMLGSITESRQVRTDGNGLVTYGAWSTVSDTCVAPPVVVPVLTTSTENQTLACPAPQTGSIFQSRTVNYTNGTPTSYGAWATTSSTCVGPSVITTGTENQTLACPAPQTGTIWQSRTVTYTNGTPTSYGAWADTGNNCTTPIAPPVITSSIENQTIACPAPQTGNIYQSRLITYTNGMISSIGAWADGGNTCVTPVITPTPPPPPPAEVPRFEQWVCTNNTGQLTGYIVSAWILPSQLLEFQANARADCAGNRN